MLRQWLGWEEHTALVNPATFAEFTALCSGSGVSSPIVVHSSRGCGRTGVFIAIANNLVRMQFKVGFMGR